MSSTLRLREVAAEDRPFLYQVYASTRYDVAALLDWSPQQKADFLSTQFEVQDTYYHAHYPDCEFSIIEYDEQSIGRLYLDRRSDELRIVDIALLPEHRGRGIGWRLLSEIQGEAHRRGLPIRIHVEIDNPALRLYGRMGFRTIHQAGIYYLMEWKAEPLT